MVQIGSYAELLASCSSFAHLLEDIHQHEEETRIKLDNQLSTNSSKQLENDQQDEGSVLLTHVDTKQQGAVRWHVYTTYIRAGLGCLWGFVFIILLFTLQQTISMFSNWWLAAWSDDESHRHSVVNKCTNVTMEKVNAVRSMSSREWTAYRNRRFHWYCSESLSESYRWNQFSSAICLVLIVMLLVVAFFRTLLSRIMCLNAGRVLHNRSLFSSLSFCHSLVNSSPLECSKESFDVLFLSLTPILWVSDQNPCCTFVRVATIPGRILNRFTSDVNAMDEELSADATDFLEVD